MLRLRLLAALAVLSAPHAAFGQFSCTGTACLVISQVYGGGGATTGSPAFKNDFIEILNRGGAPVSLNGLSVQYGSATGTTWSATALSNVTLQPGQYHLVQESGGSLGATLPTPDTSGSLAMSATTGKVALAAGTAALAAACPSALDLVGYGAANCFEGAAAAPALVNTTSAVRAAQGCTDTNVNASDFTSTSSVTPRNSASPRNYCSPTFTNVSSVAGQPAALAAGTTGVAYPAITFAAVGGSGSGYSFTQTAGTLPPGLTLAGAVLSGTPNTTVGSPFAFTLKVTDGAGNSSTADYTITVSPAVLLPLVPSTLPDATANTAYAQTLTVAGGAGCAFGTSGTLPVGITLTPAGSNIATLAGTPTLSGSYTFTVSATCDNGGATQAYTLSVALACGGPKTFIHSIQGNGSASPLAGSAVEVEGIVVGSAQGASKLSGFFLQEPDGSWDSDSLTSEGVFVFDGSAFTVPVSVGDRVRVKGTVQEFSNSGSSLTEIASVTAVKVCGTGNTFTRTLVSLPVNAAGDWERYEGMAVRFTQPLFVTGNFSLGQFGSVELAPSRLYAPTTVALPGAPALAQQALNNNSLIVLDDASSQSNATLYPAIFPAPGLSAANTLRVGNQVNGFLDGVLDDRFGTYRIQPSGPVPFVATNPRPAAIPQVGGRLRIGSANLLNFFTDVATTRTCGPAGANDCRGAADANEYSRQAPKTVAALAALNADVLAVMELENNDQVATPAGPAIVALTSALNAIVGAGTYTYINTGNTGTDVIRCAILYKPAVVTPVGSFAVLDTPVDPRVLFGNRPSIAQTFRPVSGNRTDLQTFTIVADHWRSKGSSCSSQGDPDTGDGQGNCNLNRVSMAQATIDWLASNPTADPALNRKVLLVGDFNAYAKEDPIRALTDPNFSKLPTYPANSHAVYRNLIDRIAGAAAYSYNFQSASGYLDYAFGNQEMDRVVTGLVEWHNNADEPPALDYTTTNKSAAAQAAYYAPDAYRAGDHDPIVIGLNPLPGDLDDNGVVDAADQAMMRAAFGKPASAVDRRMDYDGDGVITLRDYRIWYTYYTAYSGR